MIKKNSTSDIHSPSSIIYACTLTWASKYLINVSNTDGYDEKKKIGEHFFWFLSPNNKSLSN